MKRSILLFAPVAAVLALGTALAYATPSASPFSGTWSGPFEVDGGDAVGTMELSISDRGVFTGSFHNETFDVDGLLQGTVRDDGTMRAVGRVAGGVGSSVYDGTLSIVGGHLLVDAHGVNFDGTVEGDLTQ